VFVDRDGVINRMRSEYVTRWEEFEPLPGAIGALAQISSSGRQVIVLTNQSAIARGLITSDAVDRIHERLAALVADHGGGITAFFVCPHGPEDGCSCRKPAPGLFLRAQKELGVILPQAVMIGDQPTDVLAAKAAGCEPILVNPRGDSGLSEGLDCMVVASLADAARVICEV
jgi:D-glycero-D-manno-heptose 1,7-bisphosphate phosphatase